MEKPLSQKERQISLAKHQAFYDFLEALINKIVAKFGTCILYDIHSYNFKRITEIKSPTFNIGTHYINEKKWGEAVAHWQKDLRRIELPNIETVCELNAVFQGKGYLSKFVNTNFRNTVLIPTEIKKIYIDEDTNETYPLVVSALKEGLKDAILSTTTYFLSQYTSRKRVKRQDLLSTDIEPIVLKIDKQLFQIAKGIETLQYINPTNLAAEKRKFFSKNYNYTPAFRYRQLIVDAFQFREKLYRLDVDRIQDVTVQGLYRDVIDSYATKIDLLTTIGTDNFLYNSLRYYGEPSKDDIQSAKFILYAPEFEDPEQPSNQASDAIVEFDKELRKYGFKCKLEISNKILAQAIGVFQGSCRLTNL